MPTGAPVRLFNSMGRRVAEFHPRAPGQVGLYTCGPTVYSHPHVGNMRPYVFSDVLRRLLEWKNFAVTQVVNITDVGHTVGEQDLGADKVEEAARAELVSVKELTDRYLGIFRNNIQSLNVRPATHMPRASGYVPQMIDFATVLHEKGFTYQLDSGLYFDTARSSGYGRLALLSEGDVKERIDPVPGKRSPADFAVWRADLPGEQRVLHWDSPWGVGVPGWHLECSVMSIDLLGSHFDIHTGGVDHREIHHVNEIAQSEAYLDDGQDWVSWWLHNEFVVLAGKKIAKSAGRMPTLDDVVESGFHPLTFRYLLLTAHYRSQLDFTDANLRAAAVAYRRLLARVAPLRPLPDLTDQVTTRSGLTAAALGALDRPDEALSDDLNTPQALAELHTVLRDAALSDQDKAAVVAAADRVLGLGLGEVDPDEVMSATGELQVPVDYVNQLVAEREWARNDRDWPRADHLRQQLADLGVRVVDTPTGSRWERITPV